MKEFIAETEKNHVESVREPGNLRFDILQDASDPCKFTFYEAYSSEEAVAEHKNTPHYNQWRNRVEAWMAQPRKGVKHHVLFPNDPDKW